MRRRSLEREVIEDNEVTLLMDRPKPLRKSRGPPPRRSRRSRVRSEWVGRTLLGRHGIFTAWRMIQLRRPEASI